MESMRTTGYILIVLGLGVALSLYLKRNPRSGRKVPNAGSGGVNTPAPVVALGSSLDGSDDPIGLNPQSQTEAAYNVAPTSQADAFGPNENNSGDEVIAF
jgi:hypothetical protein